jgi:hypothetical protein
MHRGLVWIGPALGSVLIAACAGGESSSGGTSGTSSATSTGGSGTSGATSGGTTGTGGTTGGSIVGTSCTPSATSDIDATCTPAGYFCDYVSSTCQLPPEFAPCLATVGCSSGHHCIPGITNLHGNTGTLCAQPCSQTSDCTNILAFCGTTSAGAKACQYDFCGPGSLPDGGSDNGAGAYLTCDSSGTADGLCYPLASRLVCDQAGSTALYQPCVSIRMDGGSAGLCGLGATCVDFPDHHSACLQVCAAAAPFLPDGGPGCASGFACTNSSGPGGVLGSCLETCTTDCPAPLTCQTFGGAGRFCAP